MENRRDNDKKNVKENTLVNTRKLLQRILDKHNANRDLYHDLMPYKVREILLFSSLYDMFSIDTDSMFSDQILGEYHQLNLTSMPRITGVSSYYDAVVQMRNKRFDLIIIIAGSEANIPVKLKNKIREKDQETPIYLLLNKKEQLGQEYSESILEDFTRTFVWNGANSVFFTMVKLLEDEKNITNDIKIGSVKAILMVEDSPVHYSSFLPQLYKSILDQTRDIIQEVSTDDLYKVLRMRGRPKILLANNYEQAIELFQLYKDHLMCVITDMTFPRRGKPYQDAGIEFTKHVRENMSRLPVIMQSSDPGDTRKIDELNALFLDKNSGNLYKELKNFLEGHLGFGSFEFRSRDGKMLEKAHSLNEFIQCLSKVPDESLLFHGHNHHFSNWLMARGEMKIATMINPVHVDDFKEKDKLREYLLYTIKKYRNESNMGRIVQYDQNFLEDGSNIISLAPGALGGKGRGVAFINTLIHHLEFDKLLPGINLKIPVTYIIGTSAYDDFTKDNHCLEKIQECTNDEALKKHFLHMEIPTMLKQKISETVGKMTCPLAIRSSSLFEDAGMHPFSGVYSTYILPNNRGKKENLEQIFAAIKLVYASVFFSRSRAYLGSVGLKVEEEKMAILVQELVGQQHESFYYPHASGVAGSFNYYPTGKMSPEDGYTSMALGLGSYVVNGEKSFRFSPKHPKMEILSPKDLSRNTQVELLALNMNKDMEIDLANGEYSTISRLPVAKAEKHGTLKHAASVFVPENEMIVPGIDKPGPRVINFADIIKYDYIPLAKAIDNCLGVFGQAMASPVEMEFALNLDKDNTGKASLYLLQVKPYMNQVHKQVVNQKLPPGSKTIIKSTKSLGNGVITGGRDVIFVKPGAFDYTKTPEIATEIEHLNKLMVKENRNYILIGPGRWGTRDRFTGIPVDWGMISNAKVVIENSKDNFSFEASLGSHFLHNIIALNVGYLNVQDNDTDFIDWDDIASRSCKNETKFLKHVQYINPLMIMLVGNEQKALVTSQENTENPLQS